MRNSRNSPMVIRLMPPRSILLGPRRGSTRGARLEVIAFQKGKPSWSSSLSIFHFIAASYLRNISRRQSILPKEEPRPRPGERGHQNNDESVKLLQHLQEQEVVERLLGKIQTRP